LSRCMSVHASLVQVLPPELYILSEAKMMGCGGLEIMKRRFVIAVGLLSLALPGWTSAAGDLTIAGKVVDAAGKPAANVELSTFWTSRASSMQGHESVKSNQDGRFSLKVPDYGSGVAVLAVDKDRKTGGILAVEKGSSAKDVTVTLGPLVRVKGSFFCKELNRKLTWTNVYMMTPDGSRFLGCDSQEATFSFLLPPGKYNFWGYGADIKSIKEDLVVPADKTELDMQTLDVPATVIARHKGKTPPAWHVTDARGVKKDVTLADFKGKWVLVEFWGFW